MDWASMRSGWNFMAGRSGRRVRRDGKWQELWSNYRFHPFFSEAVRHGRPSRMKPIRKSSKLSNVLYDVRGPIVDAARQMEDEGQKIIKLNIGNLAPFGFDAPEEIQQDMIRNLPNSSGYSDSKGIFPARKAVMHY